ncbi:MAG: hypothetical protein ACI9UA_003533 [Pseudoalteromonas tetraodonis]|jgi:hypothetical protein
MTQRAIGFGPSLENKFKNIKNMPLVLSSLYTRH